jgi:hypothetical protein
MGSCRGTRLGLSDVWELNIFFVHDQAMNTCGELKHSKEFLRQSQAPGLQRSGLVDWASKLSAASPLSAEEKLPEPTQRPIVIENKSY